MSLADSNVAASAPTGSDASLEQALAAAVADASAIADLLDVLRHARLWLPLPDDGRPAVCGGAVTLPTVSYLGSEFVPAYSSERLLLQFSRADPDGPARAGPAAGSPLAGLVPGQAPPPVPHVVVRAADLARLLPAAIGIALNAGAPQSVPVYPQGVSYLAAGAPDDLGGMSIGPLPRRPDRLLAAIAAELTAVAAVRGAAAAWLSAPDGGEGLLVAVSLDDPGDAASRDVAAGAVERAAWQVEPADAAFPIDVAFPGERAPDRMDRQITLAATPFYRRPRAT